MNIKLFYVYFNAVQLMFMGYAAQSSGHPRQQLFS